MDETIKINLTNGQGDERPRAIRTSAIPTKVTQNFIQISLGKRQLDKNYNDHMQNRNIHFIKNCRLFLSY